MNVLERMMKQKWARIALPAVGALLLAFLLVFVVNWGMSNGAREDLMETGTFVQGVKIQGVDVSGLTMEQAEEAVTEQAKGMLKKTVVRFRVGDTVYRLTGAKIGALVDYRSVMEQAMLYGREGSLLSDLQAKRRARKEGVEFLMDVVLDESVLQSTIKDMSAVFNTTVQDAQMIVDVNRTPATYQVNSRIYAADAVVGRAVDIKHLIDAVAKAVEADCTDRTITAVWEETQPANTDKEAVLAHCALLGKKTVSLEDADAEAIHNIWKASGMLSGLCVQPGEQISVYKTLGGFSDEDDWKLSSVIGAETEEQQFGGGAARVSSALYAALLQAEVQVDKVVHHTWAPGYIAAGLDAKLTPDGSGDLVFTNQTQHPLYIMINCDGAREKALSVEVYGDPLEYTVEILTETLMDLEPAEPAVETVDESKEAGSEVWLKPRKNHVQIDIWKIRKDASGAQVGNKIYLGGAEYPALTGEKVVGPLAEGEQPADGTTPPADGTAPPAEDGAAGGEQTDQSGSTTPPAQTTPAGT